MVRDACRRHFKDLETAHRRGYKYDQKKAERAYRFFENVLRLNGGDFEGKPFVLEPSQAFIVGSLFGWIEESTGFRRFRVAYIEEGKGNGKSPLVAGIGLYGLVADEEPRAEVYAAATKKDQAMILFRDMVAMVDQSPPLSRNLKKSGTGDRVWNLYHASSGSFARPISADEGQSGPRPHIGLLDEVHEHKSNHTIEMMRAGTKGRRQALIVMITNSGSDVQSVCWDYHEKARRVCAGVEDNDAFFGFVCSLDPDDDPLNDETCWIKANPLLDVSVSYKYLREQVQEARQMPSKESLVRRLNFCQWTQSADPFIPHDIWLAAREDFTLADFVGESCIAGLDLSSTRDLTCALLLFRRDDMLFLYPVFWIPELRVPDLVRETKQPFDVWVKNGHVRTVPGKAINKQHVVQDLVQMLAEHEIDIEWIAYDRWRIADFRAGCEAEGVEFNLIPFGQGYQSMAPAVDAFETGLVNETIKHNGNPALTYCAACATVDKDPAGNRKISKDKSTGKVDGMVAALMAIGSLNLTEPEEVDLEGFLKDPIII